MERLYAKVSSHYNVDRELVRLKLDGELLEGDMDVTDADLEDGVQIDMTVRSA